MISKPRHSSLAPKTLKLVLVRWTDIVDDGAEWKEGDFKLEPVLVRTVGMIWRKNKAHLTLVRDVYKADDGSYVTGGRIVIPSGTIVSIDELDNVDLNDA